MTRGPRDRGSGSVLVLAVCAALLGVGLGVLGLSSAVLARHRAESAADLAALAGADVLAGRASGAPCERAAAVLLAHGARVVGCAVGGDGSVAVSAAVLPVGPLAALGEAVARARAGQATEAVSAEGSR
ncbi:Rv3654c family TadE-like protein [Kineococcus sp. SYSU DK006]|uniref:Rv3654c family TadE-like protein n=1 Tax=Kineococcus sp. SYSU DK006 TaxID=3383127 RepID=UPI003D7D27A6